MEREQEVDPPRKYTSGDRINFVVTEDFVGSANEFARFCDENSLNNSQAIRDAIGDWLNKKGQFELEDDVDPKRICIRSFAKNYEKDVVKEVLHERDQE